MGPQGAKRPQYETYTRYVTLNILDSGEDKFQILDSGEGQKKVLGVLKGSFETCT